jgi:hypothetical protein
MRGYYHQGRQPRESRAILRPPDCHRDFAALDKLDTEEKRQLDCGCIYIVYAGVEADVDLGCSPDAEGRIGIVSLA